LVLRLNECPVDAFEDALDDDLAVLLGLRGVYQVEGSHGL
jgi:hypothetical protein